MSENNELLKSEIFNDELKQNNSVSYRFNLTNPSNFSAYLYGLTSNANLYLYPDYNDNGVVDSDESALKISNEDGIDPEGFNTNLSAGNYLITVFNNSPRSTEYELRLVNESSSAVNIGELKDVIYKDVVGLRQPTDEYDYYRFKLTNAANFSANLYGLTNDADLYLYPDYNDNGVVDSDEGYLKTSRKDGIDSEGFNTDLSAGNYLITVVNNSPTSTEYELRLVNEASNSNNQSQIIEYPEKSPVIVENPEDNLQIISQPIQETPSANTSNDGFQSVQRYWNNESLSHIFTANQKDVDDLTGQPDLFRYEGNEFDVPINEGDPVFRYVNINTGSHFLSFENGIDVTLSQFINTGTAFNAYKPVGTTEIRPADAPANAIPIYRLANLDAEERNPLNITHFYTSDENNKQLVLNTLNYRDEFIAFWALPAATDGLV